MRIIHTADLHLESKMESNLSKEQAAKRRTELLDTFESIVDFAVEKDVSVIMISGDMFDKSSIRKTAMRRVLDIIKSTPDIKYMYLKGNHDCEAFDSELSIDTPDNMYFFTDEKWTKYEIEDVVITGRELSDDNISSFYSDLVLDVAKCNIVMIHGQESQYDGDEKSHIINIKSLKNKYIDYLALGHIHKHKEEKLDDRGIYCYPGCPEPRGFDECGEKGFVLLEIIDGEVTTEFIPIQRRMFIEKDVKVSQDMDMHTIMEKINDSTQNISPDYLVKLIISGYTDMDMDIDPERIKEKISDRFFFVKVYDRTKAYIDYESFVYDRSLKGSFVRLVQNLEISDERKADIIETGIRAIMGEEL